MKKKYSTFNKVIPEIFETCSTNQAMLQVILYELSMGNIAKEKEMISNVNEIKARILLDFQEKFCSEDTD